MNERPRPGSLRELFFAFTWLAMQGFGGVLTVVQHELVERKRWLTREEFIEDFAVAQVLPGPIGVNMAMMLGGRHFGLPGALAAMAGTMALPLLLIVLLALIYAQFAEQPQVIGALRGMGAVTAGLIFSNAFKLLPSLRRNPLGVPVCAVLGGLTFAAVAIWRWPLVFVLPLLGTLACVLAYRKLRP